jgi:chromosome segregation protein
MVKKMSYLIFLGLFGSSPDARLSKELEKVKKLRKDLEIRSTELRERERAVKNIGPLIKQKEQLTSKINESKQLFRTLQKETSGQLASYKKFEANLGAKKAEIERIEKTVAKDRAENERKKAVLDKKEKELAAREREATSKSRSVAARESALEKKTRDSQRRLDFITNRINDLNGIYKDKHYTLEQNFKDRKANVDMNVAQMQATLKDAEREVSAKLKVASNLKREEKRIAEKIKKDSALLKKIETANRNLDNKASQIKVQERLINAKEKALLSREFKVVDKEKDLVRLSRLKKEVEISLAEKNKLSNNLSKMINNKNKQLKKWKKQETALLNLKKDIDKKMSDTRGLERDLERRERNLVARERKWVDRNTRLKNTQDELLVEKNKVTADIKMLRGELALVEDDWKNKESALKQQLIELKQEKRDIASVMDKDVALLKEKEKEIIRAVKIFEKDRERLEKDEKAAVIQTNKLLRTQKSFDKKLKKFNDFDKRLVKKEKTSAKILKFIDREKKKIERQKFRLARIKDLKESLPGLEEKYFKLQKEVSRLTVEALSKARKLSKTSKIKKYEKELKQRESAIHKESDLMDTRKRELENLEGMKEEAFKKYLRQEMIAVEEGPFSAKMVQPAVHSRIAEARQLLVAGKLDDAIRRVAEIEVWMKKLKLKPGEKKHIDYDIKDLKTSIKLASL